eukprot:scaffold6348_cov259-Pinguiococcus_pyrenoidosus.AAC.7
MDAQSRRWAALVHGSSSRGLGAIAKAPSFPFARYYTHIFVALDFPIEYAGSRVSAQWDQDSGGGRKMKTWSANPKYRLELGQASEVFISVRVSDARLTHGQEYYKTPLQQMPLSVDIVNENLLLTDAGMRELIPRSENPEGSPCKQAPYNYEASSIYVHKLEQGVYYVVPSLYKRKCVGNFFLSVYANHSNFSFEGGAAVGKEQDLVKVTGFQNALTLQQVNSHIEEVREKLTSEAKRLGLTIHDIYTEFYGTRKVSGDENAAAQAGSVTRSEFKLKLANLGFSVADFPDEDFYILDQSGDGNLDAQEFVAFFKEGLEMEELPLPPPEPPVDDLLYQPIDLEGVLEVQVLSAKALMPTTTWFSTASTLNTGSRTLIQLPSRETAMLNREKEWYSGGRLSAQDGDSRVGRKRSSLYTLGASPRQSMTAAFGLDIRSPGTSKFSKKASFFSYESFAEEDHIDVGKQLHRDDR